MSLASVSTVWLTNPASWRSRPQCGVTASVSSVHWFEHNFPTWVFYSDARVTTYWKRALLFQELPLSLQHVHSDGVSIQSYRLFPHRCDGVYSCLAGDLQTSFSGRCRHLLQPLKHPLTSVYSITLPSSFSPRCEANSGQRHPVARALRRVERYYSAGRVDLARTPFFSARWLNNRTRRTSADSVSRLLALCDECLPSVKEKLWIEAEKAAWTHQEALADVQQGKFATRRRKCQVVAVVSKTNFTHMHWTALGSVRIGLDAATSFFTCTSDSDASCECDLNLVFSGVSLHDVCRLQYSQIYTLAICVLCLLVG